MPALLQDRMKSAEYVRNVFSVTPDFGTKVEDMLDPAYWAHTAAKLHPTDRIEVVAEDNTWFAELIVISCARNWAKVSLLRFVELAEDKPGATEVESDFKVNWGGQNAKHRVVRKSDGQVLKDGFQTAKDAKVWLLEYESNLI